VLGKSAAKRSAFEIGLIVEGQAKLLSPVDTGRLAGSITTQARDHGTSPESPAQGGDRIQAPSDEMEVLVGTAVAYGPYQEFGTVRTDAQPFLRPSLDLARGKALTVALSVARNEFRDYL
jgi:HK97 gp10 family phage protein